ncbi:ABC transporter permease [Aquihabitans sp. McL0605]|uniref:ABC transporter permease n=1 Tax=Aquihabitans sp. McL0605 TaxID=3415671 RepID=UPI003CEAD834
MRLERRVDNPRWLSVAVPLGSVLAALVAGAVLLALTGHDALDTYQRILERGFTSQGAFTATLTAATPLLFTGLCAAVAFRMRIFNIGGEGQLIMGAIGASGAGLALGGGPLFITVIGMVVAGALCGAAWAGIAAALRAWANTNEIITTLMLNYIAANIATYLVFGSKSYWRKLDGTGKMFPQGKPLAAGAHWPSVDFGNFTVGFGFFLGTVIAFTLYVVFRSTRFGFQVKVIGDEPRAARYAGMRTKRTIFFLLALSGAIAGIGGAADVGDTRYILDPKALSQAGYGYAGIVVAALARLNPIAVVFVAVLMGGLANAGRALQGPDFPAGLVGTLQGLLLLFTLAGELFVRYRIRRTSSTPAAAAPTADQPEPIGAGA